MGGGLSAIEALRLALYRGHIRIIAGVAAVMARMTYEPITEITDELLAMRWATEPAARMYFSRRNAAPGRLGLRIVEDGGEYRVEPKGGARVAAPSPIAEPAEFEAWAIEVDALLLDANEPAETDANLSALFGQGLTAANAAQRIINRRAADLEVATAPAPRLPPPAVVGDTLADQAAAPHADSAPVLPAASAASREPRYNVVLHVIATEDMAPIVARRLSDITGASICWEALNGKRHVIEPRHDSGRR